MPIILTSNEKILSGHAWKDITGEQYHFPNQYRNLITPGTPFIYYRGVHRADGRKGEMEYFGCGEVGEVWIDPDTEDEPKSKQNWYCSIKYFIEFAEPVLAKNQRGTIETVLHPKNHWRRAVRTLNDVQYEEILQRAALEHHLDWQAERRRQILNHVSQTAKPKIGKVSKSRTNIQTGSSNQNQSGYSKTSKITGDAGELVVFEFIRDQFPEISDLRWVAQEGETPGWDIEYLGPDGHRYCVEVKSSQSQSITAVELTANEWRAAEKYRQRYRLVLVGSCLSSEPVIEFIEDPYSAAEQGSISLRHTRFELSW